MALTRGRLCCMKGVQINDDDDDDDNCECTDCERKVIDIHMYTFD